MTACCVRMISRIAGAVMAVCLSNLTGVPSANAEGLMSALASTYATNPSLGAERHRLQATDEGVSRAQSGFRPSVSGDAEITRTNTNTGPPSLADGGNTSKSFGVTLAQPIFTGLQTLNGVREAEALVRSGRASLRSVEQATLLRAVEAYVNVIRDQAIVRLRENNVRVLSRELRATKDRFSVGEVTRTDVAQARARRAGAVSALDLARANLHTSRAVYERVVGHPPSNLRQAASAERHLPRTVTDAIALAESESPSVVSAVFIEKSAQHTVDRIRGELLPSFNIEASYRRGYDPSRLTNDTETGSISGRLTVPLYQAGEVSARIRQAKRTREQRFQEIELARITARSDAVSAWSQLQAARAQLRSDRIQVSANQTALKGVREEEKVGQRTLLDVLDAEQELLDSQVSLAVTTRDLVLASYRVLSTIGRLTVSDLGIDVSVHDTEDYYSEVRNKVWGTTVQREPGYFWDEETVAE